MSTRSRHVRVQTFGALIDAHRAEMYRYLWHLAGNPTTADDLFQETFLRALPAFGRLRDGSNHRAWLYRIATNVFLNHRRRERRRGEVGLDVDLGDGSDPPDRRQHRRELRRHCDLAVRALPPRQRAAFIQRMVQGLPYADVAAALGCTEAAARANVYQAVKRLRRELERWRHEL